MERKESKGLVAAVILAVFILLGIICCAFLFIHNRPGKLVQRSEPVKDIEWNAGEEETAEQQEMQLPDFSVNRDSGDTADASAETDSDTQSEYLCEYSSDRLLTEADLLSLDALPTTDLPEDRTIIQMVINELYAKHGYEFKTESIKEYFEQKSWYQAISDRTGDYDVVYQDMSEIERANVDFLESYNKEDE